MTRYANGARLIIYVGVPGSGKSTIAAQQAEELGAVLLNRDDTRTELFGEAYHRRSKPDGKSEAQVTSILEKKLYATLRSGGVAIDDNTNTNPRFLHKLIMQGVNLGAAVEIITVNTPLEEAKKRNRKRGNSGGRLVPEHVIDKMASTLYSADGNIKDVLYSRDMVVFVDKDTLGMKQLRWFNASQEALFPIISQDLVLVDLDGTLVFNQSLVEKYISGAGNTKKDWNGFFKASAQAPVNQSVVALLREVREAGLTIFALTGRQDSAAEHTIEFLQRANAPVSRLYMAREGDFRGDYATKTTNLELIQAEGFRVVHSVDDRPSSIRVWEERGIMVSRVPESLDGLEPLVNSTFLCEDYLSA